ncbi:MAG: serine esterase, putative [uncultured Solirubrobacteraceae bacterium]|uniref:Serine esterase, putative n=1 Tax=uncultured Solirubrobacteraceae bacterium TaxID=1162706 RepID=A0A6J4TZL3_9ACTN|nr:MAG: serine esterase, putative [uncultured Solirubrobacteraceae bacterium]
MAQARLLARPAAEPSPVAGDRSAGIRELPVASGRPTLLRVPAALDPHAPAPVAVLLHGAGSDAHAGLSLLAGIADRAGLILIAPASRAPTWDVIAGGYGPDVEVIDAALRDVFARYPVDAERVALGGFSDGASYALSLGISNGDLFTHLIAFSPGFSKPARPEGQPLIFMTHGTGDRVLPIDRCSRRLVPGLRGTGYEVTYEEFDGGHIVPPDLARRAVTWLLG